MVNVSPYAISMHIPCVIAYISIHIVLPSQSRSLGSYLTTQRNKSPRICEAIGNSHSTELPGQAKANAFWKKKQCSKKKCKGWSISLSTWSIPAPLNSFMFLWWEACRGFQVFPEGKNIAPHKHMGPNSACLASSPWFAKFQVSKLDRWVTFWFKHNATMSETNLIISNQQVPPPYKLWRHFVAIPCQARGSSTFLLSDHLGI